MNIWVLFVLVVIAGLLLDKIYDWVWERRVSTPVSIITMGVLLCSWVFVFYAILGCSVDVQGEGVLVDVYDTVEFVDVLYTNKNEAEISLKKGMETHEIVVNSDLVSVGTLNDGGLSCVEVYEVSAKREWHGLYYKSTEKMVEVYLPESELGEDAESAERRFCINCDTGIESHYKFCPDCGFKVED